MRFLPEKGWLDLRKYHWKLPFTVVLAGLFLTLALVYEFDQNQRETLRSRLTSQVTRDLATLQGTMDLYEYGLKGLRGPFIVKGADELLPSDVLKYLKSREIDQEFPGAKGFGFIRRVPASGLRDFVDLTHKQGQTDFQIKQLNPYQGEHFIIRYVFPESENAQAVGLDIASEANRRQAALTAMRSGKTTLTGPITLVQDNHEVKKGMLFLLPVYLSGETPPTAQQREQACVGWVYAPLLIGDILAKSGIRQDIVHYQISDMEGEVGDLFYESAGGGAVMEGADFQLIRNLPLFGRKWQIKAVPTAAFVADLQPMALKSYLMMGALLSILAGVLAYLAWSNHERRQSALSSQKSLIENQKLLDLLVSHAPVALAMFDTQMRYLVASPKWRAFYDLTDENLRDPHRKGVFFEERERADPMYQRVLSSGISESGETLVNDFRGQSRWIRWEALPWRDSDDHVGGLVIFSEDITEAKRAQSALLDLNSELERRVEERTSELENARRTLRTVFDAVPSMIGYWDRNEINRIANKAYADWFKVDPDKLPGMSMKALLGPTIYQANKPHIEAALAGHKQEFERSIPVPDGSGRMRHSFATYLPDKVNDEVVGFYVLVFDVTEVTESRIRLDRALRENQLLLSTIKNQICFAMTDLSGRILEVNEQFLQVCGHPEQELIGHTHRVLRSGVHNQEFWRGLWETLLAGKAWRGEICNRNSHGELFWLDTSIAPLFDNAGKIDRFVSMCVDITAQKNTLIELERAKLASDLANKAKSEFLANMSHEIRTPLNAVIGLSHLMSHNNSTTDLNNYIRKIQIASKALLSIVNDVLDLSKIEAGELSLEEQPFSLQAVLAEVEQLFAGQFQGKGINLEFPHEMPEGLDLVRGDQTRLRQALINFVGNALKFTDKGKVAVRLSKVDDAQVSDDEVKLKFEVSDTGLGMNKDTLSRLFRPFSQADTSTTRRFGGTGLGLSIVKHLVELMGGEVGVQSQLGQGSNFWFTVVFRRAWAEDTLNSKRSNTRALEVLFVSNSASAASGLPQTMRLFGWQVHCVGSLQQAGKTLDCLVLELDQGDPDWRNTLEAQLKPLRELDQALPVIALAGSFDSALPLKKAGLVDGILTHSSDPSMVFDEISRAVSSCTGNNDVVMNGSRLDGVGVKWLQGVRILLVDDSELNLEVASAILNQQGAQVEVCSNGAAAIAILGERGDQFDVVLIDIQMPVMDGISAVKEIRKNPALQRLPIVALTAGALLSEKQMALDAGMNDYLTKPFDPETMTRLIRRLVRRDIPLKLPVEDDVKAESGLWPVVPGLDVTAVQNRLNGNWPLFLSMCDKLFDEFSGLGADSADTETPDQLALQAHKLAGSAGLLGMMELHRTAKALEQGLKQGQYEAIENLVHETSRQLRAMKQALSAFRNVQSPNGDDVGHLSAGQITIGGLAELIENHDLSAVDELLRLRTLLESQLGKTQVDELARHLADLDFESARSVLKVINV